MGDRQRISFGIIALNAQPLLEYNLRALYPFAHEILVVEGSTLAARTIANQDGHSIDGTLQMLKRFQAKEDPERKVQIITANEEGYSTGFWPEKEQMSQAYAKRATGNWLWQVDSDEFYKEDDMCAVVRMLGEDPTITAVSFPYYEFFGSFNSVITGKWHLYDYPIIHRLFRWGEGYSYATHRPTTVVNDKNKDLHDIKWIKAPRNDGAIIFLFHYSYVFPKQAAQKVGYYSNVSWTEAFRGNDRWLEESYYGLESPFFLGEKGKPIFQWLERFHGDHPQVIQQLMTDLRDGKVEEPLRKTEDIERLLRSPSYSVVTKFLHWILPLFWRARGFLRRIAPKQGAVV